MWERRTSPRGLLLRTVAVAGMAPCLLQNVTYITLSLEVAMSSRPLTSATCPVPPATDPIGPLTHHSQTEFATAHHFAALQNPARVSSSPPEPPDNPHPTPRFSAPLQFN